MRHLATSPLCARRGSGQGHSRKYLVGMTSRASFDAARAGRADTIVSRFLDRAARDPERNVCTVFPMGALNSLGTMNWGDWATRARACAGSFLAMRLEKGSRIAIYSSNRELWPVAALAAAMTGAVSIGLAIDNEPEELRAQVDDADPAVVIVDTLARLKVLRSVQGQLRKPFAIVCDDLEPLRASSAESLFEWESWLRDGARALEQYEPLRALLATRLETLAPHDVASITYKRRTTVGVMHSHAAVLKTAAAITDAFSITHEDRLAVEGPFSDALESAVGIHVPILSGSPIALVEHGGEVLHAARLHGATVVCGSEATLDEINFKLSRTRMNHENLREAVIPALGRDCRMLLFASDGVSTGAGDDLRAAGVALATVYGIEEQVCICRNGPDDWHSDAVGEVFPGVEVRLSNVGELEVRRGLMTSVGYREKMSAFQDRFSDDGAWLRTAQRFERVNLNGHANVLRAIGGIADIIKLPGGASTNAVSLEAALASIPHVAHAVCSGAPDQSLVAVLSLRRREVEAWALSQGVVAPWAALVEHPLVYDALARGVAEVNATREGHERVSAFASTDLEFSVHTGELDFRGQVNRPTVLARFEHVFAELHNRRHH